MLAYLVVKVWYPDFFFQTDGGWQGLRLLLGVDLVLGPMLTLIVYRAGKPGLRFDLTVIGLVQLICLTAGVWIVHGERPLAIVYTDGSFYSVTAQSFKEIDISGNPGILIENSPPNESPTHIVLWSTGDRRVFGLVSIQGLSQVLEMANSIR